MTESERKAKRAKADAMFDLLRRRVEGPIKCTPNATFHWRAVSTVLPRIVREVIIETDGGQEYIEQGLADIEEELAAVEDVREIWGEDS